MSIPANKLSMATKLVVGGVLWGILAGGPSSIAAKEQSDPLAVGRCVTKKIGEYDIKCRRNLKARLNKPCPDSNDPKEKALVARAQQICSSQNPQQSIECTAEDLQHMREDASNETSRGPVCPGFEPR